MHPDIDIRILSGEAFTQHVYCEGQCVRKDKRAADYDFTDLQAAFPDYSFEGAYHIAESEKYRPPYNEAYVSVYFRGVDAPETFRGDWEQHFIYGFGLKFNLATKEVLLKIQKLPERPPEFLAHTYTPVMYLSLQGNIYDKKGNQSEYTDYYLMFHSYSALMTMCDDYNITYPIDETQYYEKAWVFSIVCNGINQPLQIIAYLDMD
jgi:hypothetical protein